LDALENVSLPMVFGEVPPGERRGRAAALLDQVGLSDRGHHFPNQLSGGQQQRVAIARALVNRPLLVLCDEPTGNLDSESGLRVMELLSDLRETGCTLIVVTHDLRMKQYASQMVYLLDGRVVSETAYAQENRIFTSNINE
jgi:putative ABC transport system ATP-binding protein